MNSYQTFIIDVDENIGIVKVNRPEALNALNSQFFDEMGSFLGSLDEKSGIHVLIITGEG